MVLQVLSREKNGGRCETNIALDRELAAKKVDGRIISWNKIVSSNKRFTTPRFHPSLDKQCYTGRLK